jgi:hypothetical protein
MLPSSDSKPSGLLELKNILMEEGKKTLKTDLGHMP